MKNESKIISSRVLHKTDITAILKLLTCKCKNENNKVHSYFHSDCWSHLKYYGSVYFEVETALGAHTERKRQTAKKTMPNYPPN